MNKKLLIITGVVVVVLLILGSGFYLFGEGSVSRGQLEKLKQEKPQLTSTIDDLFKWQGKLKEDKNREATYVNLGLLWKTIADQMLEEKYYAEALRAYEQGVKVGNGQNTLLLVNAGNMAIYLKDYTLAEKYYKQALEITPGDTDIYIRLANLYKNQMKKPQEEIVMLLDQGIKRAVYSQALVQYKQNLLERSQ